MTNLNNLHKKTQLIHHRCKNYTSFNMDERTVSIKVHSLCLLLQVTFALSHAGIKHDLYTKVIPKLFFISIDVIHKIYGQESIVQICCIPLGISPLTFCRDEWIQATLVHCLEWIYKPSHHYSYGTKRMSAIKHDQ